MPYSVDIHTGRNYDLNYEVASLGDRSLAFFIDVVIMSFYTGIMCGVFIPLIINFGLLPFLPILIATCVPVFFYTLLFETFNEGQTPGKKIMQIKVVALDGYEVTPGMHFLRWIMRLVDLHTFSGILALLTIAFTDKAQRLGDMVAETTVISLKTEQEVPLYREEEAMEEYIPEYPESINLNPRDIHIIKETLMNDSTDAYAKKILLSQKLEEVLDIERKGSSEQFLKNILSDHEYLKQAAEYK